MLLWLKKTEKFKINIIYKRIDIVCLLYTSDAADE